MAPPTPISSTAIGGGGRRPGERFRVGGTQPAATPDPPPPPAPPTTTVSAPATVTTEEPSGATQTAIDRQQQVINDLRDEIGGLYRAQEAASAARAEQQRQAQESAYEVINNILAEYDLADLGTFVQKMVFEEDIIDTNVLLGEIRQTEVYKQRFAGNIARRNAGYNVLSEGQYIALENSYRQLMRQSGLPVGFYDTNEDFNALIANDVSVAELAERVNQGYEAVANADPAVISEMRRLYNIGDGELAAYFLDPEKATPTLIQQARSAQIGGQAVLQAGMQLTAEQAEDLARAGISEEQARAGFQAIEQAQELFAALPGQTGEMITEEEQVAGVFGTSAAAQQRIRRRTRERQAEFEAGGRFAAQGTQVTGLT